MAETPRTDLADALAAALRVTELLLPGDDAVDEARRIVRAEPRLTLTPPGCSCGDLLASFPEHLPTCPLSRKGSEAQDTAASSGLRGHIPNVELIGEYEFDGAYLSCECGWNATGPRGGVQNVDQNAVGEEWIEHVLAALAQPTPEPSESAECNCPTDWPDHSFECPLFHVGRS